MNPPQKQPAQNIYQMYEANGNKAGFYVRRNSWSAVYACVTSVAGRTEGSLVVKPPYFGNPPVTMDVFNNDGTIRSTNQILSCPGNYTYKIFQPKPRWQ
jgi:hypothetical protein